jgi:hypothetical protein
VAVLAFLSSTRALLHRSDSARSGLSTADVDNGTLLGIRLELPQDLVGDWGGVSLPEEEVAEQVRNGIALRPAEVAVRLLISRVVP